MSVKEKEFYCDLQERIRDLHTIIKSCERHGEQAEEHVDRLRKTVTGMENVLKKSSGVDGAKL